MKTTSGKPDSVSIVNITPEAAIGGPLGLVKTGDRIKLDVANRKLELLVSDAELDSRRKAWRAPPGHEGDERGYRKLFLESVQQADRGCDFDFLAAAPKLRSPS